MKYISIETTFKNKTDAERIIKILLNNHLVACGQYYPITSIYNWKNKEHKENETLLILKTKAKFYKECEQLIKQNHPYITPQITVLEINGNKEYLDWIDKSTNNSKD